jgi:ferredoxin
MSVTITIDGTQYSCEPDLTVFDVAREHGIHIPTLCYIPIKDTARSGRCRMCLVEVLGGGRPGLQSSCTLPVNDGLEISTISETVYQGRRTVVELLLTEHTQDCRNCPKSGDCNFSTLCKEYDINGVPVCSECPNQKEGCLLQRGVLCVGPITHANCGAFCTTRGYPCEGCFTTMVNEDILRFGLEAFQSAGFAAEDVISAAEIFSTRNMEILKGVMREMGYLLDETVVREIETPSSESATQERV